LIASPYVYGRTPATSGVAASYRRRTRVVPSIGDGGSRQCGSGTTSGKTTTLVGWLTLISELKSPNGSPVRMRSGPSR
jgi:hypothetical protein